MRISSFFFATFIILKLSCHSLTAQLFEPYPTANLSTTWTNDESGLVLLRKTNVAWFTCGFIGEGNYPSFLFAIFISVPSEFPSQYKVVWAANRNYPVSDNVILNLIAAGELVLTDVDGSIVWTTNTAGKSVAGMNLTDVGNLVLFDNQNSVVWQSFDHPTNCLLPSQNLFPGQKLKSSVSLDNSSEGMFSLQVTDEGLFVYVESNPPYLFYDRSVHGSNTNKGRGYARFLNGSLSFFIHSSEPSDPYDWIDIPPASSAQYMKLMPDGHLEVFEWYKGWGVVTDLTLVGQASSLPSSHQVHNVTPSQVQNVTPSPSSRQVARVVGSTVGTFVLLLVVATGFSMYIAHKRKRDDEIEEEYLDQVPGMPTRFFYDELEIATENFSKKLGAGGFGSVFEGSLKDGSKIAVKCLEGLSHVKKSFLAEVQSIGSIHHVNLVRLRGFCTWKSQRFLVYDFMSNGSLDRWIYNGVRKHILEWECRKKIIRDIAKGLAYLHEDCRQKIVHLDIKPQNILLDDDFNAKVSDFGLSKLIDKNQTQVMTTMRGTPGYLAPEWLSSVITEKVDVYSFGIVLLEILCGRKNFDRSLPEEKWHLLHVFQNCSEQESFLDMVDMNSRDMQINGTEVVEMMKLASWCLQTDYTKRPSMSSVVKVLEGGTNVESDLDYNFTDPIKKNNNQEKDLTPLLPSVLSGPR